ncbi:tyrosine-type recombinase/integrase [Micromonospora sp. NPDC050397]|uniref:tyrosine-type recombinase/integrase n=1 Tax=Micromonospora sp. NPDC050397 TaxID=3364279 RepID=UPI00384EFFDE
MGWVDTYEGDGQRTYYARYRDRLGIKQTQGIYTVKRDAEAAAKSADVKNAEGRMGDPRRGRQSFERYVIEQWLPFHVIEASTLQGYTYQINRHLIPYFGAMRLVDITPTDIREWVSKMTADGMKPKTLKNIKNILSAIFTTALNDQIIFFHPCKGVTTPHAPTRQLRIITPEQFDVIYDALPDSFMQLLVEVSIETGLRWGELTELRVGDLDKRTGVFSIQRAVVQIDAKFHPDGENFLVKEYPKDRDPRRVDVTEQVLARLLHHIAQHQLGDTDLIFRWQHPPAAGTRTPPNPDTLGLTEPNEKGRQYRHGTTTAYTAGKCRCQHCRDAFAIYRAKRRNAGKDSPRRPRQRHVDADGHIPREWFRNQIWKPALAVANIGIHVRPHDLRHAHASWLVAAGVDLQKVKDRLGHASITTSEKYLHTLPDLDKATINAFASIRNRSRR